jgi:hypothetical protein
MPSTRDEANALTTTTPTIPKTTTTAGISNKVISTTNLLINQE